jgi:hypothetical protein
VRKLVDAQQLDQHYENSDGEIKIARSSDTDGGGHWQAAQAQREHQRALTLQDEIRDLPVARGDHQAKKKSRNFQWHAPMLGRVTLLAQ